MKILDSNRPYSFENTSTIHPFMSTKINHLK